MPLKQRLCFISNISHVQHTAMFLYILLTHLVLFQQHKLAYREVHSSLQSHWISIHIRMKTGMLATISFILIVFQLLHQLLWELSFCVSQLRHVFSIWRVAVHRFRQNSQKPTRPICILCFKTWLWHWSKHKSKWSHARGRQNMWLRTFIFTIKLLNWFWTSNLFG